VRGGEHQEYPPPSLRFDVVVAPTAIAVIPARFASERFPGKALTPIAGVPMVVRVVRNVRESRAISQVIVATDDTRIADAVTAAGAEAVLTSPDLPSGSDRVWAAVAALPVDIVVNVQGDEPLLPGSVVDRLVERLGAEPRFDVATPVVATPREHAVSADVVTVACDGDGTARYFSRAVVPHGAPVVWRHIGVYAYRKPALERFVNAPPSALERSEKLEQLRALALDLRFVAVEVDVVTHAVDRAEDVTVVERLLANPEAPSALSVRLVVLDVDGVLTDGRISYPGDDEQLVSFDVKDGYGITALLAAGIEVAILSARDSAALRRRARELEIPHLLTGVADKADALTKLAEQLAIPLELICYVGDDDPDLAPMGQAGMSAAPADASAAVRAAAGIALSRPGGRGAVRELAERLLGGPGAVT
jgi:3-deoxy-D-manno-octulosonate cytidylyltransferase